MAKRKLDAPYEDLGRLITSWRKEKTRSALALFREHKFSFSYSTYVDYERGVNLPKVQDLVELAVFFGKDARVAVRLWAAAQMPTPELQAVFTSEAIVPKKKLNPQAEKPNFENSWAFGPADFGLFQNNPWLWDVILSLCLVYPRELELSRFQAEDCSSPEMLLKTIQRWIDAGYVIASESGIRLRRPYVHVPDSDEWLELRNNNITRAVRDIVSGIGAQEIQKKQVYRETIHRTLTQSQLQAWVEKLQDIGADFRVDLDSNATALAQPEDLYAMVLVLGRRHLGKSHAKKKKKNAA